MLLKQLRNLKDAPPTRESNHERACIKGSIHQVISVATENGETWLMLENWPDDEWLSARFRKVTPPKDMQLDIEDIDLRVPA